MFTPIGSNELTRAVLTGHAHVHGENHHREEELHAVRDGLNRYEKDDREKLQDRARGLAP